MVPTLKGFVPILYWDFDEKAAEIYNADTWNGWDQNWKAIGSNGMGDALVMVGKWHLCEVRHGTGESAEAELISKDLESIVILVNQLQDLGEPELEDLSAQELIERKRKVKALRHLVPGWRKESIDDYVDDIEEALEDVEFEQSPGGEMMKAHASFCELVYPALFKDARFLGIIIARDPGDRKLVVVGELESGETVAEIKDILNQFEPPFPLVYGEFRDAHQ